MSDHVTMIHEGKVVLNGSVEDIRGAYHVTALTFAQRFERLPKLDGTLTASGGGRTWSVVHETSLEELRSALAPLGGEIGESRSATLEEIFIARVGRTSKRAEAA
jgi:ABC-2 type transport system ATP-binding protein